MSESKRERYIRLLKSKADLNFVELTFDAVKEIIELLEETSAEPEIIRCKDCKYWRQQTNYQGAPLSFGFCESGDIWQSLYGETYEVEHIETDDDFYCGYADMRGEQE